MTETAQKPEEGPAAKSGAMGLVVGLLSALALGGGGFYVVWSGLVPLPGRNAAPTHESEPLEVAFVPLDPIIVTINGSRALRQLRVTVQLDVPPESVDEVTAVLPRVVDALNSFLRAVGERDLADTAIFPRLQSQMLRRAQVIVGEDKINDLLVTEFILN